jgi:hypothetical protein
MCYCVRIDNGKTAQLTSFFFGKCMRSRRVCLEMYVLGKPSKAVASHGLRVFCTTTSDERKGKIPQLVVEHWK